MLESSGGRVPSISRQPPTAISPTSYSSYWTFDNTAGPTPSSTFGSRYTDSNDDVAQHSPSFRPGNGNEDMGFPRDDRRPSVASATTISSTGSKSSIGPGFRKKLQGFFGDEYSESRQNSETSLPPGIPSAPTDQSAQRVRNRKNSVHNTVASTGSRPTSPSSSRPRTPLALSEVTPWEYQGSKVSLCMDCVFLVENEIAQLCWTELAYNAPGPASSQECGHSLRHDTGSAHVVATA